MKSARAWLSRQWTVFLSFCSDTWFLEILSLVLSIFSLAGTVGILIAFNNEPLLRWTWRTITLNTAVSILTVVAKTLLLFVISSCLGQWKYINFARRDRDLIEFDVLDSASRGPGGSAILLIYWRLGPLALIGAALTLLSLGLDPFAQQIIGFGLRQTASNATIPQMINFKSPYATNRTLTIAPDLTMSSAIMDGLSGTDSSVNQRLSYTCPSADCRWDDFETLGVCSDCADITDKLTKSYGNFSLITGQVFQLAQATPSEWQGHGPAQYTIWTLPNELHLDAVSFAEDDPGFHVRLVSLVGSRSSWGLQSNAYRRDPALELDSISMILNTGTIADPAVSAQECVFSMCVKRISSVVTAGVLTEQTDRLSTTLKVIEPTDSVLQPDLWVINDRFDIENRAVLRITNGLKEILVEESVNITETSNTGYIITGINDEIWDLTPAAMQGIYRSVDDLVALFERVATSMTNDLRIHDANNTRLGGTSATTVYVIRWPWIALPLFMMLASCLLLVLTMLLTKRKDVPLWKCSSLPILKCGADTQGLLETEDKVGEMEEAAEKTTFSLFAPKLPAMARSVAATSVGGSQTHSIAASISGDDSPPAPSSPVRSIRNTITPTSRPVSIHSDAPTSPVQP